MRDREWAFWLRLALWLLALGVAWRPVSSAYLKVLQAGAEAIAQQLGMGLQHGPNGLSAWFVVAVAILAASALSTRRRLIAIGALAFATVAVDACFVLLAASTGASQEVAGVAYGTIVALVPITAVLLAIQGRPAALWSPGRSSGKSGKPSKPKKTKRSAKRA